MISLFYLLYLTTILATLTISSGSAKWDCNRPWPELELFLPVNIKPSPPGPGDRSQEWDKVFLHTLLLFWPLKVSNTSLRLLLDEEHIGTNTHSYVLNRLQEVRPQIPGGISVSYNAPIPYYKEGHDRQQLLMFYADNYTKKEYVGFVDTDCIFLTYIDREDIFENGLPVVNGQRDAPAEKGPAAEYWRTIPANTYMVLGVLQTLRCMSYFPVVVKTIHMRYLREYVERRHGRPFYEVFKNFSSGWYSQFNIMCTYLFEFHQDEYTWYAHEALPNWDGHNPPAAVGQNGNRSIFAPKMFLPKPRIASHFNYRNWGERHWNGEANREYLRELIQNGICFSPPFPKNYSACNFFQLDNGYASDYFEEMHMFEFTNWNYLVDKNVLIQQHIQRNDRIRHCNFKYNQTFLEYYMKPLVEEGDLVASLATGKAIFLFKNQTFRVIPDWDTFVNMGFDVGHVKQVTSRVMNTYPMGLAMPHVGRRLRKRRV